MAKNEHTKDGRHAGPARHGVERIHVLFYITTACGYNGLSEKPKPTMNPDFR
jgi:hypothetical protein